jgi:transposase InsO family protein
VGRCRSEPRQRRRDDRLLFGGAIHTINCGPSLALEVKRVHRRVYATRDAARRNLFGYIGGLHNPSRPHSALGYKSSADTERLAT